MAFSLSIQQLENLLEVSYHYLFEYFDVTFYISSIGFKENVVAHKCEFRLACGLVVSGPDSGSVSTPMLDKIIFV